MSSDKYSLIIVPGTDGQVVNKQIGRRFLLAMAVGAFCFAALFAYFAFQFVSGRVDRGQIADLRAENTLLASKISSLEKTVAQFKADMSEIMEMDERIRLVFDLPPLDPDLREVGVGGAASEAPVLESELGERTWLVEEDIEKIQRQLQLENASFEDLLSRIQRKKSILNHTPTIKPCDGFVTRGFGMYNDPFTGSYQPHNGVDIAAPKGTPVHAAADGRVKFAGRQTKLGKAVIIDHGSGILTYYGHLSKIEVKRGQKVKRWDVIGLVGSTGYSTGPHLHYEVRINRRPVNPYDYMVKTYLAMY